MLKSYTKGLENNPEMAEVIGQENLSDGIEYGIGCWVEGVDKSGNPSVFSSPGYYGYYPWIDLQRNYLGILFVYTTNSITDITYQIKGSIEIVMDGGEFSSSSSSPAKIFATFVAFITFFMFI